MPTLPINDTELAYNYTGRGEETIVFSHGLLFDRRMYDAQVRAFRDGRRCLAYDHRGQGESGHAAASLIDMETLYADAAKLIERFDIAPVHFVGLSMGGFVGMRLASRRPDLIESLTLASTRAASEPFDNRSRYRRLNWVARWLGMEWVVDRVMPLMFGETFMEAPERADQRERWRERLVENSNDIYRAVDGIIHRPSFELELDRIDVPTLVLHGEEDRAIPIREGRRLAEGIDGAEFRAIPEAGHSASIENPEAFNRELRRFLDGQRGT
jgi:pimeloyl-ACP methyl ester carboxylesterase